MTLSGPLALLANQTTGDKFYIRGVRPSPRPPPGAMEPEPGGAAAALLRQKRAALRRRGCSFESPRYSGPGGVRPGGAEVGSQPRGGWRSEGTEGREAAARGGVSAGSG